MSVTGDRVSTIRSRDKALGLLLPKLLGLLWERGVDTKLPQHPGTEARIRDIEVSVVQFRENGFAISVYAPTASAQIAKVFSAHLAPDPSTVASSFFPYQAGHCGVLSWKRGPWEDRIVASDVEPRPITALLSGHLVRGDNAAH